jgi:membrane protease YdiL (CAAX protease family)
VDARARLWPARRDVGAGLAESKAEREAGVSLRPMRPVESMVVLVATTFLGIACFYALRPYLESHGWRPYPAYLGSLSLAFIVLLVWSVAAYLAEGQPRTRQAFLQRTRLESIRPKMLLWGLGLGLFMFLLTAAFSPLLSRAASSGVLRLPGGIPDYLNPSKQQSIGVLKGQFAAQGILPLIPFILALNILAEELFWRGMVFPRQEMQHGRRTYLIHGPIWALSHLFQYWMLPPILIGSLALAWVFQRTHSTWVSVVAHLVNNAFPFFVILLLST